MCECRYEYAQPVTYTAVASVGTVVSPVQLENPFNTDAEARIEFFNAVGTSGVVGIAADSAPTTGTNLTPASGAQANGALGYILPVPFQQGWQGGIWLQSGNFSTWWPHSRRPTSH